MRLDEIPPLMRRLRRAPLHDRARGERVDGGRDVVTRVLPHRDPFLFVDRIVAFDPGERTMLAERRVPADDPVFTGHFPGAGIFPAALQIEAIGQASLCLWSFAENGGQPTELGLRVTKVEQAQFLHPVLPDDVMELHAQLLHADDLAVTAAGQVYVRDTLCAVLVIQVTIVDGAHG